MSTHARNLSTRLFVQAAFTGLVAPIGSRGGTWLAVTFAIAAAAVGVALTIRDGHERLRELVVGFEAVALAVGVVGLLGHHYIPGTIVGIAALIAALNTPASLPAPAPVAPVVADQPAPAYAAVPAQPAPQAEAAGTAYPQVPAGGNGRRAIDVLPGK
jgi:apolipoprotein N-acyltransferase